jgi:hypothetical protein
VVEREALQENLGEATERIGLSFAREEGERDDGEESGKGGEDGGGGEPGAGMQWRGRGPHA